MGWWLLPDTLWPFKIYCASSSIISQLVPFLWQTVEIGPLGHVRVVGALQNFLCYPYFVTFPFHVVSLWCSILLYVDRLLLWATSHTSVLPTSILQPAYLRLRWNCLILWVWICNLSHKNWKVLSKMQVSILERCVHYVQVRSPDNW